MNKSSILTFEEPSVVCKELEEQFHRQLNDRILLPALKEVFELNPDLECFGENVHCWFWKYDGSCISYGNDEQDGVTKSIQAFFDLLDSVEHYRWVFVDPITWSKPPKIYRQDVCV
jgi:hypothetical protein